MNRQRHRLEILLRTLSLVETLGYNRSTFMAISIGQQLGSYEITALLGKGGMGEVYRARDLKLKREVAIKIIPEEFSRDGDRVSRFQREAEVLASVNHPNIAGIHDLAEVNGARYLVLELVEGETLMDRIARGPIPVEEALTIAKQICEALEAAHEKGIVHRDLKPANIKFTHDGRVKVLDFGLAKMFAPDDSSTSLSNSPTLLSVSERGLILGTAAYMSPEQARGKPVDRATDVWAFGCVTYEMLTGRAAFEGDSVGEILGSIFGAEPDWSRLPQETPANLRRLLRRCLQKDSRLRLHDIHDVRLEIEEPADDTMQSATPVRKSAGVMQRLGWAAAAVVTLLAIIEAVWPSRQQTTAPATSEVRLEISTPPTTDPLSLALSPDGKRIVFVATSAGRPQLWLRPLDSVSARPLPGTEYSSMPFWSPDSRSVAFFANSRMEAVDIESGSIQQITSSIVPAGATWNSDGVLLFPLVPDSPLFRISTKGGAPIPVPNLEPRELGQRDPEFLPDGHHFLYYVAGDAQKRGVYIGDLNGAVSRRLLDADSAAVYAPTGHLFFVRQGTLFAQALDNTRWELSGKPHPVAEQVAFGGVASATALSASAAGPIAYRTGSTGGKRQLLWFDRSGQRLSAIGEPLSSGPAYMSVSPDYKRLAVQRSTDGNADIWLLNLDRDGADRFTTDARPEIAPIWSPHGDRIVFSFATKGSFDLYQKSLDGSSSEELLANDESKQATDWSPDGQYLLYRSSNPKTGLDIWALPLTGNRKPFPVARTDFEERDAQFSPDGKWIAYQSNDSGRFEIYMQPFPGPGPRIPVSTGGGAQVRWRRDGKELFYIALNGELMAVSFDAAQIGKPVPLFLTHVGAFQDVSLPHYIPSPDGQRFLMDTVVEENAPPITVILNWKPPSN
jgi:serine/threonine protein kinase